MIRRLCPFISSRQGFGLLAALFVMAAVASTPVDAQTVAPKPYNLSAIANTNVTPGGEFVYTVAFRNSTAPYVDGSEVHFRVRLAPGLSYAGGGSVTQPGTSGARFLTCASPVGSPNIECSGTPPYSPQNWIEDTLFLRVAVDAAATGSLTSVFEVEGGGPLFASNTDTVVAKDESPLFGFKALDFNLRSADGKAFTQAGGMPNQTNTYLEFPGWDPPGALLGPNEPVEDPKNIIANLPPGLLGNPSRLAQCRIVDLSEGSFTPKPRCLETSQVGLIALRIGSQNGGLEGEGYGPLYNLVPPPDVPARFGFNIGGTIVVLDAHVRNGRDYGLEIASRNTAQVLPLLGSSVRFWGVPFSSEHDTERGCYEKEYLYPPCAVAAPRAAFLRMPTACTGPGEGLPVDISADSWQHPGQYRSASVTTHEGPGYPLPPTPSQFPAGYTGPQEWGPKAGIEGCDAVPFDPSVNASLTTPKADSPSGLIVDLSLPDDCWNASGIPEDGDEVDEPAQLAEAGICQSDMRRSEVVLPQGVILNPSSATGREACSPDQIGVTTALGSSPIYFDDDPPRCPDASKIGTVEIETPLLGLHEDSALGRPVLDEAGDPIPRPLKGSLYLAEQVNNPFNSLLSFYLVAEGSGVVLKQAARVSLDPKSGQLTTIFEETPQTPFSKIHFELFGGPRAALRTPSTCGTYSLKAALTPWSGTGTVERQSSFAITEGCGGGFDPGLNAGVENPLAGAYSPFHLQLTRGDGSQELSDLRVRLPQGLLANLSSVSYCPDPVLGSISSLLGTADQEVATPSCPAASLLGTVTVGAGSGPNPFYSDLGRVYWAGPYKGAPVSIAAVVPALAGPFDLGSVVVRNGLHVDPDTAEITAQSHRLPSILAGIPLALRDVRLDLTRPNYTLNPTSCEPKQLSATLTSVAGATAERANHFQVANCDRLGFRPKLSLRLKGAVHRRAHPSLIATVQIPKTTCERRSNGRSRKAKRKVCRPAGAQANIARAQVKLPPAAFLDNSAIAGICTRVQFAADACPQNSIYGRVWATSPILPHKLAGNVYLRSSAHKLPDLVADLRGPDTQPIEIALAGRTDSVKGALRNTFEVVPDAPVDTFRLQLFGGKRGLIEMSTGFCARPRASVLFEGHNGTVREFRPKVSGRCGKAAGGGPRKGA
jgi:hypothetical protein